MRRRWAPRKRRRHSSNVQSIADGAQVLAGTNTRATTSLPLASATGSVMVGPVRTEAGLWAVLEVWSDFRDAFTPHDVKMMDKVVAALAKKTPAA